MKMSKRCSLAQVFLGAGEGLEPVCPTIALGCQDSKQTVTVKTAAALLPPATQK